MISELQALISTAEQEIKDLEEKIFIADKELQKCREIIPVLQRIMSNSLEGAKFLNLAVQQLNNGIKINGEGQGHPVIQRAEKIIDLNEKSDTGVKDVKNRALKLERDIDAWNARIAQLRASISAWQAEIARLEAEAAAAEAEEAARIRRLTVMEENMR